MRRHGVAPSASGALCGIVLDLHETERRHSVRRVREIKGKRGKSCAEQVRHEHGERDAAESGAGQLRHDQPRAEAALAAAEEAPGLDAVDVVLPLGLLGPAALPAVLRRPAGPPAGHLDAAFLAIRPVLPRPVNPVHEDAPWIAPGPLPVSLDDIPEHGAFVVRVGRRLFQARMPAFVHAHVVFRAELHRRLRLAAHDRADERLRDADDPVPNPVLPVVEHLLLLLIQPAYRAEDPDVAPVFQGEAPGEVCVHEVHVAPHRAQHDADERAHPLRGAPLRLRHGEVPLPQHLAVRARPARLVDKGVQPVDHAVQLLPGLVQEREVLRVAYVRRRARRVENHRAEVPVCARQLLPVVRMFGSRPGVPDDELVDFVYELHPEALAKLGQDAVPERALGPVALQPDEILVVWVAGHLLDEIAVAELRPVLYDQRPERHPRAHRRAAALRREQRHVPLLDGGPVDAVCDNDPLVPDVQLHAAGLVEVLKGHLDRFSRLVHARAPAMCGVLGRPACFYLHIV